MKIVEHLVKSIRAAARYNSDTQVAPACILWPDPERQWEKIIPIMQAHIGELLILGGYDQEQRKGPAIWLRCVIEEAIEDMEMPAGATPVIYLPGVSRQVLRSVESCPDLLKPLAELQYRGAYWSQVNGKDWTILALLKSKQGGLDLNVDQDQATKNVIRSALDALLDQDVELLKTEHLSNRFFHELKSGGDSDRHLLQWLDKGEDFKSDLDDDIWSSIVESIKAKLAFDPEKEGALAGVAKLAEHQGLWQAVWERYCEAPQLYPNVPDLIRKCNIPDLGPILWEIGEGFEGWPQWNDEQEEKLRCDLAGLANISPHDARKIITDLEKKHAKRRSLIWAKLGESPLALALEHLALLAEQTEKKLAGGNIRDMVEGYCDYGWLADDAALKAMDCADKKQNFSIIAKAIRSIYKSWLDDSARHLQSIVATEAEGYPGGDIKSVTATPMNRDACLVFVDGLRYDIALRLSSKLKEGGFHVEQHRKWAALPTVTATGKPAVSPVSKLIAGQAANTDFEPIEISSGKSLKGGQRLKTMLENKGWALLEGSQTGNAQGKAWCETGNIDHLGHKLGCALTNQLEVLLQEITERITELVSAGWPEVRVITDHGWLLLPDGLPKIDLPASLTENKWGRCAVVKTGAITDEKRYPWYWNPTVYFALAEGASCYRSGLEYAHGGISLQECLNLELVITPGASSIQNIISKPDIKWLGLRCKVHLGEASGIIHLDVRQQPGVPSSSVIKEIKAFKGDGTASIIVENEDLQGVPAFIVLLDKNGALVAQYETTIGGDDS